MGAITVVKNGEHVAAIAWNFMLQPAAQHLARLLPLLDAIKFAMLGKSVFVAAALR